MCKGWVFVIDLFYNCGVYCSLYWLMGIYFDFKFIKYLKLKKERWFFFISRFICFELIEFKEMNLEKWKYGFFIF